MEWIQKSGHFFLLKFDLYLFIYLFSIQPNLVSIPQQMVISPHAEQHLCNVSPLVMEHWQVYYHAH